MHLLNSRLIPRRSLLKAAGVSLALPMLEAMRPLGARAWAATPKAPKRMVVIGRPLGMHTPFLFPSKTGRDYELTPYLNMLAEHRNELTLFSGMSHPGYANGHSTSIALFTGAPWDRIKNERDVRNTVSIDQLAVELVGKQTRHPSLVLGANNCSWSRTGTRVPGESKPHRLFMNLFVEGKPEETLKVKRAMHDGGSVLDQVQEQARSLQRQLGPADRDRLEQYFTSVREAETQLQQDQTWIDRPKPKVDLPPPSQITDERYLIERTRNWYNLVHLAFQTDSTRVIALWIHSHGGVFLDGKATLGHHDLSHHGQDDTKIEQLARIESAELAELSALIGKLKATHENDGTLLDNCMVFHGSNLSNANSHSPHNLPILLAGGGFKHGQYLAYDPKNNRPLCDLYLSMLQRFGLEADAFSTSQSTIAEIC